MLRVSAGVVQFYVLRRSTLVQDVSIGVIASRASHIARRSKPVQPMRYALHCKISGSVSEKEGSTIPRITAIIPVDVTAPIMSFLMSQFEASLRGESLTPSFPEVHPDALALNASTKYVNILPRTSMSATVSFRCARHQIAVLCAEAWNVAQTCGPVATA